MAARTLPSDDPCAHIFFEERTDLRMTLASSGFRDLARTRTRGATIAGRRSVHVTDPALEELPAIATAAATDALPSPSPRLGAESDVPWSEDDSVYWVADLEAEILTRATEACIGRRESSWSARLVAFHQMVWVGIAGGAVIQDTRRGCRMEIRAQVGIAANPHAVEELVIGSGDLASVRPAFSRAFERAEERSASRTSYPPGPTTAVFAPGVAGVVVHELIGHALEGDVAARRPTWIRAGGLPRAGTRVTVRDDPPRGRAGWRTDDEGVIAQETLLIDRGQPAGMLLDRSSASAHNAISTGHGRRSSYLEAVLPRMGCTFIDSGDDDPAEVLRSTRRGVFIRRLVAGHTDPFAGSATFVVSDSDRIVDGRLAGPVDAFVLELEGLDAWRSIDRIAHDLAFDTCVGSCVRDGQSLAVSVGAPTIRIGVVTVRS